MAKSDIEKVLAVFAGIAQEMRTLQPGTSTGNAFFSTTHMQPTA